MAAAASASGNDHLLGCPLCEGASPDWVIACRDERSLIADDDDAVSRHQHVAALDRRQSPRLLGSPPPDGRSDVFRVELVDGLHQQRLVVTGGPVERVERQAAVDPQVVSRV